MARASNPYALGANDLRYDFSGYYPGHASGEKSKSIMLHDLVEYVDAMRMYKTDERHQLDILKALVNQADACADPVRNRLALLRLLVPQKDTQAVYGMSCKGILTNWAKVSTASSKSILTQFLDRPVYARRCDIDDIHLGDNDGTDGPILSKSDPTASDFVCYPERTVSAALSAMHEVKTRQPCLTILDAVGICERITNAYHNQATLTQEAGVDLKFNIDVVTQEMKELVKEYITPSEARFLTVVLLRRVTQGVRPSFVFASMHNDASKFLERNNDYAALAEWSYKMSQSLPAAPVAMGHARLSTGSLVQLTPGMPFVPMACKVADSPYVMNWLFTRTPASVLGEGRKLPPLQNSRLLILSKDRWYIPLGGSGDKLRTMCEIKDHPSNPANNIRKSDKEMYKLQIPILLEIQAQGLLNVDACIGLLISYEMTADRIRYDELSKAQMHIKTVTLVPPNITGIEMPTTSAEDIPADLSTLISDQTHPEIAINADGQKKKPKKSKKDDTAPVETIAKPPPRIIVQEKYDGDRMQVHVDEQGDVKMFTRNGKKVDHIYTDVRTQLETAFRKQSPHIPKTCVLDGELIVVQADGKPAPWISAKWRYDSGNPLAKRQKLAEIDHQDSTKGRIVTLIFPPDVASPEDDPECDITVMPAATAKTAFGEADNDRWDARVMDHEYSLQFIIFDVLYYAGRPVHDKPCSERLSILNSMEVLKHNQIGVPAFKVVSPQNTVSTCDELVKLLQESIRERKEGLVLKHPDAAYQCKRTADMQKVKIKGPDINCVVIGAGFRFTGNPRNICLIAGICDDSRQYVICYCRVEHLQGDHPSQVIEYVMGCPSIVATADIKKAQRAAGGDTTVTLKAGPYSLRVSKPNADIEHLVMQWDPVSSMVDDAMGSEPLSSHTVHFWQGLPDDMQFMIVPSDCHFGLSIFGDLRPLTVGENVDKTLLCPVAAVPRFPVGRIEFDLYSPYADYIDTPATTKAKFAEAEAVDDCIRLAVGREVNRLRRAPVDFKRLLTALRILYGRAHPEKAWQEGNPEKFLLDRDKTFA